MPYKDIELKREKDREYYQKHKNKWVERSHRPDVIARRKLYQQTSRWKEIKKKSNKRYREGPRRKEVLQRKREWYRKRKLDQSFVDKLRKHCREYRYQDKFDVIKWYSNGSMKCASCGFDDFNALTIDHIDYKENYYLKYTSGSNFYRELKRLNYPVGFQVLCANCQNIKRYEHKEFKNHVVRKKSQGRNYHLTILKIVSPELKCAKCGFSDVRALHIDHKIANGHNRGKKQYWEMIREILFRENLDKYQVLCANCNLIKQHTNKEWRGYVNASAY